MKVPIKQYYRLLSTYLRSQWRWVAVLALLILITIGLRLANPQIVRVFIDTAIEGGADANAWRSSLEAVDDPKAFHMCHFTLGLNSRARMSGYHLEDGHILGAVTFGFGAQDASYKGTVGVAKIHTDATLVSPTITIDGVMMCENNRLNSDLGLGGL